MENPFTLKPYETRAHFCDREEELRTMVGCCTGRADMTLISQRRMGKTGLVLRLFDELSSTREDMHTIYLDIFASRSLDDFIKLLAEATMKSFRPKTSIGERLMAFIRSLRPQLTFDNITGEPQLQIGYQTESEKEHTLQGLLEFLDSQGKPMVVAIDEFQQIRDYPEQNMEALLRTYIQRLHNLTFVFCGSKKHLMTDIFANEKRPFYASTSFLTLKEIGEDAYSDFIVRLFGEGGRRVSVEALDFILKWTRRHTFYTQQLCHTVYANGSRSVTIGDVKQACEQLMRQGEAIYLQYRQMLTDKQWNYLIAVSKEGSVRQITASEFLKKHRIGSASASKRLADSLCEKGLLNDESTLDGTVYTVNDVFLSRWMERL